MIKLDNFTWGFELEGMFAKSIVDKVYWLGRKKGFSIETKYDGSVEYDNLIRLADFETQKDNEGTITEINVGVFDKFKEMVKILEMFGRSNYISDDSCGLHIHINAKKLIDKQILTIVREWVHRQKFVAKRFNVSKERLEHTCRFLPKRELSKLTEKAIHAFRNNIRCSFNNYGYLSEKYYSLNASHLSKDDYGTLEFRMFSSTTNFKEIKEVIYFVLHFIQESLERE